MVEAHRGSPRVRATWPSTAPISATPVVAAVGVVALVGFVLWERHRARIRYPPSSIWGSSGSAPSAGATAPRWRSRSASSVCCWCYRCSSSTRTGLSTLGAGYVLAVMARSALSRPERPRVTSPPASVPRAPVMPVWHSMCRRPGVRAVPAAVVGGVAAGAAARDLRPRAGARVGAAHRHVLVDIPTSSAGQGSATQSTVRQLGAALGTAILGTVLSLGLAHALTDRLEPVGAAAAGGVGTRRQHP